MDSREYEAYREEAELVWRRRFVRDHDMIDLLEIRGEE